MREKAVTQGKIADILQARGQLDEALRIRTEEQLPVYERLGDVDGTAHVRFSVARLRLQRGDHETGDIGRIRDDLAEAFSILLGLRRPDGIGTVGALFAQVLAMMGHRRKALEVLDKAKLAFKKMGSTFGSTECASFAEQ